MDAIAKIKKWLESHEHTLTVTDPPYMQMSAELQDWGFMKPGRKLLSVGYWGEQNGDMVPDPNVVFTFDGDNCIDAEITTWLGTCHRDHCYAVEFAALVYERHFQRRVAENANGGNQ